MPCPFDDSGNLMSAAKERKKGNYLARCISIGTMFGVPLGLLFGNIALGIGIGVAIGAGFGALISKRRS
jgi:uncharacterized membrane protein